MIVAMMLFAVEGVDDDDCLDDEGLDNEDDDVMDFMSIWEANCCGEVEFLFVDLEMLIWTRHFLL